MKLSQMTLPVVCLARTRRIRTVPLVLSLFLLCASQGKAQTSSAAFLRTDTSTQGNWHGAYGADG